MVPALSKEFLDIQANYWVWILSETRTWHDNIIRYFLIVQFQSNNPCGKLVLSNSDTKIMKVVQPTHQQGDIIYGTVKGVECLCISLMSVFWTLLKSASISNSFDLDCILQKGELLFKFLNNYRNNFCLKFFSKCRIS